MVAGVVTDLYAAAKRLRVDGARPVPRKSGPRDQEEGFFARQERYIKQQGRKNRGKRREEAGNAPARAKRRMDPSPSADQLPRPRHAGPWADAQSQESETPEGPAESGPAGGHGHAQGRAGNGRHFRGGNSPRASRAEDQYSPRSQYDSPHAVEPQAPHRSAPRRHPAPEGRGGRVNASFRSTPRDAPAPATPGDDRRRPQAAGSGSETGSQRSHPQGGHDSVPALPVADEDVEHVQEEPDVRAGGKRGRLRGPYRNPRSRD